MGRPASPGKVRRGAAAFLDARQVGALTENALPLPAWAGTVAAREGGSSKAAGGGGQARRCPGVARDGGGETNVIGAERTALGTIQQRLARYKRVVYGVVLALIAVDNLAAAWFMAADVPATPRFAVAGAALLGALLVWLSPRFARPVEVVGFALGSVAALAYFSVTLQGDAVGHAEAIRALGNWSHLLFVLAFLAFGSRQALWVSLALLLAGVGLTTQHVLVVAPLSVKAAEASAALDLTLVGVAYLMLLHLLTYSLERRSAVLAAEETATKMLALDPLTGATNRAAFHRVHESLVRGKEVKPFALFLLDIDDFKTINERFGTAVGDDVLRETALRLRNALGDDALVVARLGADEFGILVAGRLDEVQAGATATLLERVFRLPFAAGGGRLQVTSTVGISRFPADAATLADQISQAEAAVAAAKLSGESYRLAAVAAREAERRALASDLREAVGNGELELYFQPVAAVHPLTSEERAAGYVVGVAVRSAEALLRWHHPRLGLIPPGEFIPLAERAGLMVTLGEWVLEAACAQARAWHDGAVGTMTVSVNVSPHQFSHPGLVPAVERALARSGLSPERLVLEITETSFDQAVVAERLTRLRRLGVRVAIDDFGAGYSSLGRLRSLPIDFVKLDRSFVAHLGDDDDRTDLVVRATVQLAHGLGAKVIAEGIESGAQAAAAAAAGCDYLQGYLIARPVSGTQFGAEWRSNDSRRYLASAGAAGVVN